MAARKGAVTAGKTDGKVASKRPASRAKKTASAKTGDAAEAAAEAAKAAAGALHAQTVRGALSVVQAETVVPPRASKSLCALSSQLIGERERLVEALYAMVRRIPDYGRIQDESFWDEVRQLLPLQVELFFRAFIEGSEELDNRVSTTRYFARRRLRQGISLESHLEAYRSGMWLLWEQLVNAAAGDLKVRDELLMRAAWVFRHIETIGSFITDAYFAEQQGEAGDRTHRLRRLIDDALAGNPGVMDDLVAEAADLHLDAKAHLHVLVLVRRSGAFRLDGGAVTLAVAESLAMPVSRVLSLERSGEVIVLLPRGSFGTRTPEDLVADLGPRLTKMLASGPSFHAGLSGEVGGVPALRRGYREAVRAAEIGARVGADSALHYYPALALDDVFELGSIASRRIIRDTIGPLNPSTEQGRGYVETLDAYFRSGLSLKVAAADLAIHPNTLAYRMRRIEELTGLDPTEPGQRLRAEVATRLLAIQRKPT